MVKEIVGLRPYDFKDEKSGDTISGYSVYLQWEEEEVAGIACEKLSVSMSKLQDYDPALGDRVLIGYNKYGKCDFIVPAPTA